jgi:hypothetical protein
VVLRLGPLIFVVVAVILLVVGNTLARLVGVVILGAWIVLAVRSRLSHRS